MNLPPKSPTKIPIKKISSWLFGGLALVTGVVVSLNWTLLWRAFTYPDEPITTVDWYKPLETVSGVVDSTLPTESQSKIPQNTLKTIANYAQQQNSSALLVMHQGKLVLEKYWRGHTPTSVTNSMSMSKTLLALLIGIAIEEQYINSELETVASYLPEWSKDERAKITIQDLLYMQSGLRNEDDIDDLGSDLVQMYISLDAAAVALKIPAVQPRGKFFEYNNANSQILGMMLEKVTKKRYADYLSRALWQPLQARNAAVWLDRIGGTPKSFCCFFATARDWAKIGQLFLDRGRVAGKQVVSSEWIEKMLTPSSIEPTYGYHIWLKARTENRPSIHQTASEPFLAQDTFYLDGGSRQRVFIIPSKKLVIIRVGEQPNNWDDSFIPNTLVLSLSRKDRG